MYTARNITLSITLKFAWRSLMFFIAYNLALVAVYEVLGWQHIGMPFAPVAVIGTAVAFMVGFKNNSSYERLWEGRRAWGSITNLSRTWGIYITEMVRPNMDPTLRQRQAVLIKRHLAYINALRAQLRRSVVWIECENPTTVAIVDRTTHFHKTTLQEEIERFLPHDEFLWLEGKNNFAAHILRHQAQDLGHLYDKGLINDFQHMELSRLLKDLYEQQGACERLKTFPFPRQYAYYGRLFVWIFILLLPIGVIDDFARQGPGMVWLTIPFCVLISWIFNTMEVVGDSSENPFENGINDVPITAICRNIEIDLLQMLEGETIPQAVQAEHNILL